MPVVVHSAAAAGLAAVIVAIFGVSTWVAECMVVSTIAIVVTVGAAYMRP